MNEKLNNVEVTTMKVEFAKGYKHDYYTKWYKPIWKIIFNSLINEGSVKQ